TVPPPQLTSFTAAPNGGYINAGAQATLSWTVANCAADCSITLQGRGGFNDLVLNAQHLPASGSLTRRPGSGTRYTLTVTSPRGTVSQEVEVKLYASGQPAGSVFYFKMTNEQSQVTPCFAIAVYAGSEAAAKSAAEAEYGGYTAESIDADQFLKA